MSERRDLRVGEQGIERLIRESARFDAGAAYTRDALLLAHAEHGLSVGQGRTRVATDAAEAGRERHRADSMNSRISGSRCGSDNSNLTVLDAPRFVLRSQ